MSQIRKQKIQRIIRMRINIILFLVLLDAFSIVKGAPVPCHQYTNKTQYENFMKSYEGDPPRFAPPYNVFLDGLPVMLTADCEGNKVILKVSSDKNIISKKGLIFFDDKWYDIKYTGEKNYLGDKDFLVKNAATEITVPDKVLNKVIKNGFWFLAEVCTLVEGEFKCACAEKRCRYNYNWNIQYVKMEGTLDINIEPPVLSLRQGDKKLPDSVTLMCNEPVDILVSPIKGNWNIHINDIIEKNRADIKSKYTLETAEKHLKYFYRIRTMKV